MIVRILWIASLLLLALTGSVADTLPAALFAQTPAAGAGEFITPRTLVADASTSRLYLLDSGLERVLALTPDGQQLRSWTLASLHVETPLPADPLLPSPALVVGGGAVYLVTLDRTDGQVQLIALSGPGQSRTLDLPDGAFNGAVAMDAAGRLLVVAVQVDGGKTTLVLSREGDTGQIGRIATLDDPCDGQCENLSLTGFTIMPDGRFAIGLAQGGKPGYTFIRSWLAQGTVVNGKLTRAMTGTHCFVLLDGRGVPMERFRASVALAGKAGYPPVPCVPLFTSLAFGPEETVISGGHTVDPFLRVYGQDGTLLHSIPRQAVGGQHLATLLLGGQTRVFATATTEHRVTELLADGRVLRGIGAPAPYDLAHPVTMAADHNSVFVITRTGENYQLNRFTVDGRFRWAQPLTPPREMASAEPLLAITTRDRAFIGWRLPKATGVGWVETVMEDGTPGIPLWNEPVTTKAKATAPCDTPLLTGQDGRVYVLRELKGGLRLYAYSATGTQLMVYPSAVQGISMVTDAGRIGWVQPQGDALVVLPFTPQGTAQGWKRIPRPARDAHLLPALADGIWGWLTSSNSLLKFDDNFMVVNETTIVDPSGDPVNTIAALAGDGVGRLYIALPDRILVVTPH